MAALLRKSRNASSVKLEAARLLAKKQDWRGVGVECSNAVLTTLGEVSGGGTGRPVEEMIRSLSPDDQKLGESILKFLNRSELLSFAPKEMSDSIEQSETKKLIGDAEKVISKILEISKKEKSQTDRSAVTS